MKNPLCCDTCAKKSICTKHSEDWNPTCCSEFINNKGEGYYDITASRRYKFYNYWTMYKHPVLHIIGVVLRRLFWLCIIWFFVWGISTKLQIF